MRTNLIILVFISCLISSCREKNIKINSTIISVEKLSTKTFDSIAFDTDGYYLPVDSVQFNDFSISSVLFSTSSDKKDKFGYKQINNVEINLFNNLTKKEKAVKAVKYNLENKKISIEFGSTEMGKIRFNGQFLGVHGAINDNVDDNQTIIVLKGTFMINDNFKKETKFTYFAGE